MDKLRKGVQELGSTRTRLGDSALWALISVCVVFFLMAHVWNLNGRFVQFKWDGAALGSYSHQLWSLSHFAPADPGAAPWFLVPAVMYLLAPIYRLFPSPLFLPIVQTVALAAAAVAVFFVGNLFLPRLRAMILALLFCFYPPIYAICTTSFNPAFLALPFLTLSIFYCLREKEGRAMLFASAVVLFGFRAGLAAIPLCLWAAARFSNRRWHALAALLAVVGTAGWISGSVNDSMGPFLLPGVLAAPYVIYGLCRLEGWADRALSRRSIFLALLSPIFFAGVVFASAVITPAMIESHPGVSRIPVRQSAMTTLLDRIPADSQVLTTPVFLPRLSNRSDVGLLGEEVDAAVPGKTRYALADLGGAGTDLGRAREAGAALRELMKQGWGPVQEVGGVVLFSDRAAEISRPLFTPDVDIRRDRPYLVLRASGMDTIELVGFTMNPDADNTDLIRFSFYWRKLTESDGEYAPRLSVVGDDGSQVYSVQRLLCYGLYPFSEWKVGEIVKDDFVFVVPEHLQGSEYELRLSLLERPRDRGVEMTSPVEGALDSKGRVRLIALDAI